MLRMFFLYFRPLKTLCFLGVWVLSLSVPAVENCRQVLEPSNLGSAFSKNRLEEVLNTFDKQILFGRDLKEILAPLQKQGERIEFARRIAETHIYYLALNFKKFEMSNEQYRVEIARRVAEKDIDILLDNFSNFQIFKEENRLDLLNQLIQKNLYREAMRKFDDFKISSEANRIQVAEALLEKSPYILDLYIEKLGLSEHKMAIELYNWIAEKNLLRESQADNALIYFSKGMGSRLNAADTLTLRDVENIFGKMNRFQLVSSLGREAINYLRMQKSLTAKQLAELWLELVFVMNQNLSTVGVWRFTNTAAADGNGRFLFKGDSGQSLLIDKDGAIYYSILSVSTYEHSLAKLREKRIN